MLGFALGALALFWPLLGAHGRVHWGGDFDSDLMYWIFEWGYSSIWGAGHWADFWQANSFYPHAQSLAYSDSLLTGQLFYGPLRLLGADPLRAMQGTLIAFCLLGCLCSDLALRRAGLTWLERLTVIIIAHFGLATTAFLPGHYQLFAFQLGPGCLTFMYLFWRDLKVGDALAAVSLFAFATGFATYFGPMTVALVFPYSLWRLTRLYREVGWRRLCVRLIHPGLLLPTLGILIVLYVVQIHPYLALHHGGIRPSTREIESYAAWADSLFQLGNVYSYWHADAVPRYGAWEYAYFPGYLPLCAALFGLSAVLLHGRGKHAVEKSTLPPGWLVFVAYIFTASWVLSLGPRIELGSLRLPTPYAALRDFMPGFSGIRAPGRFGLYFGLMLGTSLVLLARQLSVFTSGKARAWILPLIALAAAVESLPLTSVYPFQIRHEEFYRSISADLHGNKPLLILPIVGKDHLATLRNIMEQLKGSTLHGSLLPVGYGYRCTAELDRLIDLDRRWMQTDGGGVQLFHYAAGLGIAKVLVFVDDYPQETRSHIVAELKAAGSITRQYPNSCSLVEITPK